MTSVENGDVAKRGAVWQDLDWTLRDLQKPGDGFLLAGNTGAYFQSAHPNLEAGTAQGPLVLLGGPSPGWKSSGTARWLLGYVFAGRGGACVQV